jgi:hypothetical protein
MHNGLDLHARGDKVFAMLHGIVHKVGYDKRSGIFVTLRHGDITISYCHLSKVTVRKGDVVSAGTVVGITGNTGRSTGEHLHITCKLKGNLWIRWGCYDFWFIIRSRINLTRPYVMFLLNFAFWASIFSF